LLDGSWAKSLDKMAKLAALAVCGANDAGPAGGWADNIIVTVNSDTNPTANGLFNLVPFNNSSALSDVNARLNGMAAQVSVLCKGYTATQVNNTKQWNVVIGQGPNSTSLNAWTDALNNCVVVKNNLEHQDLSYTVAQLKGSVASVPVLDLAPGNSVQLLDQFNYGNFLDHTDNPVIQAKLQLNGHDRFQVLDGYYFNYVQPYQHFSNTPSDGVNVYSFALKAEDHQPTGTCNFSRIDNATLQVDLGVANTGATASALGNSSNQSQSGNAIYQASFLGANASLLNIFTVNYNVLRVMSGMAGTAYSN